MVSSVPLHPPSRDLLKDKSVVTVSSSRNRYWILLPQKDVWRKVQEVMLDWHDRRLNEAVNQLNSEGYNAASVVCDVTKEEDVQRLIKFSRGEIRLN